MTLIKYMGTSDNRVLKKGEDFGGQLAEPLTKDVSWTVRNNHVVNSEDVELSDDAVQLLLELEGTVYGEAGLNDVEGEESTDTSRTIKEFKDVTNLKVIPPSLHQSTFLGLKGIKNKNVTDDEDTPEPDADTSAEVKAKAKASGKAQVGANVSAPGGGGTPAVGGSTDGAGGQTTSSGTSTGTGTGDTR